MIIFIASDEDCQNRSFVFMCIKIVYLALFFVVLFNFFQNLCVKAEFRVIFG